MTEIEREQTRRYVENWRTLSPILEQMRREEVRAIDTATALQRLEDAFASAQFLSRPADTSGLVQQQALFARALR